MNKSVKNTIIAECAFLNDAALEDLYYESLFACLGTQVDTMIELDFDFRDIKERRDYEKFLCEKCSLIESICIKRGIQLFKRETVENT